MTETLVSFTLTNAENLSPLTIKHKIEQAFASHSPEVNAIHFCDLFQEPSECPSKPVQAAVEEIPTPAAEPAVEPVPVPSEDVPVEEIPAVIPDEPAAIDESALKEILFKLRDTKGSQAVRVVLEAHANGAKSVPRIDKSCYAAVYAAAKEALNA